MRDVLDAPAFVPAMCVGLLIFTVSTGLWLDGRPARKEAKREAARRRRERVR